MRWSASQGEPATAAGNLLVVPMFEDQESPQLKTLQAVTGQADLARMLRRYGFKGKAGARLPLHCPETRAGWVLLVGLGKQSALSLEGLRHAAAGAARHAQSMQARTVVAVPLLGGGSFDAATVARCWVEGAELALAPAGPVEARDPERKLPAVWKLLVDRQTPLAPVRAGVREGEALAEGCLLARRLVNLPPNELTPARLADEARALAAQLGLRCTVLGPPRLRKLGMGGLLGVGQGSRNEPCLICLESRDAPRGAATVALVGKGVTFDSGGLSLKPGAKMDIMKCDMAGAAAVLGAALIITRRALPVRLVAVVPAAENMPDGNAIRPADILTMASGKTVEVLNTDAEGRLILADALHWVCGRKPDHVIDIATLTGACVMALGTEFAGVMGTSGELIEVLEQAGGETGERVWPLPLIDAHREALRSRVADLKNMSSREGGALTAAAFLAHFVPEDIAWAHLDIAGPAWAEKDGPLGPVGGTGFGARLLARAVEILVD